MRILIAPDAFKGSLTSFEAAAAMTAGIQSVMPDANIITMPLADGGEGTMDVLQSACGGRICDDVLYVDDYGGRFALIESARFIGLNLASMQPDVFKRGSASLGRAVLRALDAGVRDIRIALGGSVSVDAGLGFLIALGCQVKDSRGMPVSSDLNGLMQAFRIDMNEMDQRLSSVRIMVLCDVRNRLCGGRGAVYLYGPQKGIQDSRLSEVETAMQHWGLLCEHAFGVSVMNEVGTGAAGGLGFALGLLDAQLVSGAEYVMAACGFDQKVLHMDWVVTGEGRSDVQTLHGKLPAKVADIAHRHGVKTALISGGVEPLDALDGMFDSICVSCPPGFPVYQAVSNAQPLLQSASALWAKMIKC